MHLGFTLNPQCLLGIQKVLKEFSVEGLKVNGRDILEARKQAKGLEQDKKSKCQVLGKKSRKRMEEQNICSN